MDASPHGPDHDPDQVPVDPHDNEPAGSGANRADAAPTGVASVLDDAVGEGYTTVFEPEPGAVLRCRECGTSSPAAAFERSWQERLEGASDPDDMAQVSGLTCPACGARGTFVSLFGPGAGVDTADVLVALQPPSGTLHLGGR